MNKVLLFVCILFSLIACDDKNENVSDSPIQNLKMPSSETVFATGEAVSIEGIGFNSNSQIWLRTSTKAGSDIQTEISEVSDKFITFIVPEKVEGFKNIILKQENKEYILGKLNFQITPPAEKNLYTYKYNIDDNNNVTKQIVRLNKDNGQEELVATLDHILEYDYLECINFIPSTKEIVGFDMTDPMTLIKTNIETGDSHSIKLKNTPNVNSYYQLIIDDAERLYTQKKTYHPETVQIANLDYNNGTEKIIATFDASITQINYLSYMPSTKEIVGLALISNKDYLIKTNIETGAISSVLLNSDDNIGYSDIVLDELDNLYAIQYNFTNDINVIVKIDANTGDKEFITNINIASEFNSLVYLPITHEICGFVDNDHTFDLVKVNIKTKEVHTINLRNNTTEPDYEGLILY